MKLLTKAEAAARCRVSLAAFDAHVRPALTPKKIGRRVLFLESDVALAHVHRVAQPRVSRPSLRQTPGGTWNARYRMNGKQREVSLGTKDEFEARVAAARMFDRLSNLTKVDGPGVYLITCGGLLMKIGRASKSIRQRFGALQTSSPQELLLSAVLSPNPNDEKFFHAGLQEFHAHGEWFVCSTESLEHLARLVEVGP